MRLVYLLLPALSSVSVLAQQPTYGKTKTFWDVTKEPLELPDPGVRSSSVVKYLAALHFPDRGLGNVSGVARCHDCDSVNLEIASEMGTTGLNPVTLGDGGRIVARVRHVDWKFWRRQQDLALGFHDEAYLWISKTLRRDSVYEASLIRIDDNGVRHEAVKGRVWYCANSPEIPGPSWPAGQARWKPPHICKEPSGSARAANFHLTSWFPCDQGCCIFADDHK